MAPSVCSIPGCGLPVRARGWCTPHYNRWRRYGDPATPPRGTGRPSTNTVCQIDGCDHPAVGRGWCSKHYTRWIRKGDPLAPTRGYTRIGRL